MATYITLWKYTRDGLVDIRHTPERFEAVKAIYQKNGGKLIEAYSLIGPYDIMTIGTCRTRGPSPKLFYRYAPTEGSPRIQCRHFRWQISLP